MKTKSAENILSDDEGSEKKVNPSSLDDLDALKTALSGSDRCGESSSSNSSSPCGNQDGENL